MFKKRIIYILFKSLLFISCSNESEVLEIKELIAHVETFAGGDAGFQDGSLDQSKFFEPTDITLTPLGELYVIDQQKKVVRKITKEGIVTTVHGPGNSEFTCIVSDANGTIYVATDYAIGMLAGNKFEILVTGSDLPSTSYFHGVTGMDIHPDGNIYFAERSNNRIMQLSPTGSVTKFAGGSSGYKDGVLEEALFSSDNDLMITEEGEFYISDALNHRIRKISARLVSTLAGTDFGYNDGPGSWAKFRWPEGMVVAADGSIYIADSGNHNIRRILSSNDVSTIAGPMDNPFPDVGYIDAAANGARFFGPESLVVANDGSLYVSDTKNNRIRKIAFR